MKKFNIEDYDDQCVMHCKNIEEAREFLSYLDSIGRSWRGGGSYLDRDNYDRYGSDTCYRFTAGEYCYLRYFRDNEYTILNFEEFDWSDTGEAACSMSFEDVFYGSNN